MEDYIEVTAKTVEDCITDACQKLSVVSDRLEYVVVNEGSNGFLGIGAKPAVIKARVKEAAPEPVNFDKAMDEAAKAEEAARKANEAIEAQKARKAAAAKQEEERKAAAAKQEEERKAAAAKQEEERKAAAAKQEEERKAAEKAKKEEEQRLAAADSSADSAAGSAFSPAFSREEEPEEEPRPESRRRIPEDKQLTDEQAAAITKKAEDFLTDVFDKMKMEVKMSFDFDKEWNTLNIDFAGDDMGVLIGKRGQTLDSLQYLVSLVINHDSEPYIHVKTDTENYRARRKETLEALAKNIAFKVRRTRRPVELEPMNPYERRIIHSALQSDRYVTTHSEGEEPYRHVVVTLKSRRDYH